jgi:hypothetical protein
MTESRLGGNSKTKLEDEVNRRRPTALQLPPAVNMGIRCTANPKRELRRIGILKY